MKYMNKWDELKTWLELEIGYCLDRHWPDRAETLEDVAAKMAELEAHDS